MSDQEEEVRADLRPGDAAEEPLETDKDSEADQIEEATHEARTSDPRIAQPPS
jgi:hypothetical protein